MALGDGCISFGGGYKNGKYSSGKFSMKHGWKQKDYLEWKTRLLSKVIEKEIKVYPTISKVPALNSEYQQYQMSFTYRRMKAWNKIFRKNKIKDIPKMLQFISDSELAGAIWIMDDGSCNNPKKKNGTVVFCGLVLYICDQNQENADKIVEWWKEKFEVTPKLKFQKTMYKGEIKYYPHIRFSNLDSIKIWNRISKYVEEIPSMQKKFESLKIRSERKDLVQPQTRSLDLQPDEGEEIVQQIVNR